MKTAMTMTKTSKSSFSILMLMTLMLSRLLIPAMQLHAETTAPAYIDLDAVQLDQLVAPIALDPDSLVAQILTASTYPDQVAEADSWLNQHMNQPPDQRADGANNMSWDPAVKGLIEFPAELDMLAKNTAWTSQLGNAYYNQPGDVMNAIQAMRLQAQQAKVLVTTAQQRVVVEAGVIEIVPVNPAVIYVPYYNPWRIWGTLFVAYPGFVVLPPPSGIVWAGAVAFDPGIAVGVYEGYGWGVGAWAPAWDGGTVVYNNNTYISNSVTVVNHGYFGGRDRGVFEHEGRGVPHGYHACAHAAARAHAGRAMAGRRSFGKPSAGRSYGSRGAGASHSAYAGRGTAASHRTATANRGRSSFGHGSTTATNRGRSTSNHGTATASRNGARASHGTTMAHNTNASRSGAAANHGAASANHSKANTSRSASSGRSNATASRNASANHGTTTASRGASTNRGTRNASANHGNAMANRGGASGNRSNATANHGGSTASRSSAMASRGGAAGGRNSSMGSRNTASANRSNAMGNHGSASTSRGAASASRGGSSAVHSGGGGHAAGGRGKGR